MSMLFIITVGQLTSILRCYKYVASLLLTATLTLFQMIMLVIYVCICPFILQISTNWKTDNIRQHKLTIFCNDSSPDSFQYLNLIVLHWSIQRDSRSSYNITGSDTCNFVVKKKMINICHILKIDSVTSFWSLNICIDLRELCVFNIEWKNK